jgi:hypothetical protein
MATTPWEDGPVTTDERYLSSVETSDLTIEGGMIPKDHKSGAADVVGAAGLGVGLAPSPRSTGMALLRLHGEWTSALKPRRVGRPVLEVIAARIRAQDLLDQQTARRNRAQYAAPKPAMTRAADEAQRWYANELRLLATRLKSRAAVLEQLSLWAAQKGIAPAAVAEGLHYWLDDVCPICDMHGFIKVPDQPTLSTMRCKACAGSGKKLFPAAASRVVRHIEYCLDEARGQLRKRLAR